MGEYAVRFYQTVIISNSNRCKKYYLNDTWLILLEITSQIILLEAFLLTIN